MSKASWSSISSSSSSLAEEKALEIIQHNKDRVARHAELNKPAVGLSGGMYIPPHKLRAMQAILEKGDAGFQRLRWDALRKSINGIVNKITTSNIKEILPELFRENIVRGRGLLCRSIMKAQIASPSYTSVYAALIAVVNTKMPEIGELLLKRVVMQFRRSYKRNDKLVCLACTKFLAHLVNQQVAHEIIALQLLTLLLENPTDDSVEVAVDFVKESGHALTELTPKGVHGIFERFRAILHEGQIDRRVQYMIEGLFAVRKNAFADYIAIDPELDLVELDDQITHEVSLDETHDVEEGINVFKEDPEFEQNEIIYEELKKEILGDEEEEEEEEDGDGAGGEGRGEEEGGEGDDGGDEAGNDDAAGFRDGGGLGGDGSLNDASDQNVVHLRRQIYLTIMSSLDFEECCHKLLKIQLKDGQEVELCNMVIECCSQERTFLRFYGNLAQRLCQLFRKYADQFDDCFAHHYATIHRFETNRIRNIGKLFAHLLCSDALEWGVLAYVRLNEEETTSSSRIFIKIIFRELSELMGLKKLKTRLEDPLLGEAVAGIFPTDHAKNTRFAINFFTTIGLGGLTEKMREYLKNAPKQIMAQQKLQAELAAAAALRMQAEGSSSSSSSSDSDSDSDSSSSDSDSDSESSSSSSSDSSSDSESANSDREGEEKKKRWALSSRDGDRDIDGRRSRPSVVHREDKDNENEKETAVSQPFTSRDRHRRPRRSTSRKRSPRERSPGGERSDRRDDRRTVRSRSRERRERRSRERSSREREERRYPGRSDQGRHVRTERDHKRSRSPVRSADREDARPASASRRHRSRSRSPPRDT